MGETGGITGRSTAEVCRTLEPWAVRRSGNGSSKAGWSHRRVRLARTTVDDVAQASGVSRAPSTATSPGAGSNSWPTPWPGRSSRFFQRSARRWPGPGPVRAPRGRPRLRPQGAGRACGLPAGGADGAGAAAAAHHGGVEPDPADDRRLPRPFLERERRPAASGRAPLGRTAEFIAGWCCRASVRRRLRLRRPRRIELLVREQLLAGVLSPGAILPQHP